MEIKLKNIGMIKEANVLIDGLTVIAGENDTGKSTVGKAILFILEFSDNLKSVFNFISEKEKYLKEFKGLDIVNSEFDSNIENFQQLNNLTSRLRGSAKRLEFLNRTLEHIEKLEKLNQDELKDFDKQNKIHSLSRKFKSFFKFEAQIDLEINLISQNTKINFGKNKFEKNLEYKENIIFIETPIILNLFTFFSKLDTIQNDIEYDIMDYPYTLRHLYKQIKLGLKNRNEDMDFLLKEKNTKILNELKNIINGEFDFNSNGELIFIRDNKNFDPQAVATGIKTFGIIQMLIKNNYLEKGSILILDEPEVHLHPKWQLKMAEIIVELVKNGVKVVVNSHSPYMIEALKRYSELNKLEEKTNFYLAEDGYINKQDSLENIFETLALPMRELKKLKMKKYIND